jgi:hypothetical protein
MKLKNVRAHHLEDSGLLALEPPKAYKQISLTVPCRKVAPLAKEKIKEE